MVEVVGIQFDNNVRIYYFDPAGLKFKKDQKIIVDTVNGHDLVSVAVPNKEVTEQDVVLPLKSVVRVASNKDLQKVEKYAAMEQKAKEVFLAAVKEEKLDLQLVKVNYSFDGSQIVFRYTAENRVDFRELVRKLARQLNRRIEMRQINMREKASLIGGVGPCGYELCCRTFLHDLHGSTIKMVKNQKLSLIPERISGVCDKLLCCLRYEDDIYTELSQNLPDVRQKVMTPDGEAEVTYVNVLNQTIDVIFPSGGRGGARTREQYHYDDLKDLVLDAAEKNAASDEQRKEKSLHQNRKENDRNKNNKQQNRQPNKKEQDRKPSKQAQETKAENVKEKKQQQRKRRPVKRRPLDDGKDGQKEQQVKKDNTQAKTGGKKQQDQKQKRRRPRRRPLNDGKDNNQKEDK